MMQRAIPEPEDSSTKALSELEHRLRDVAGTADTEAIAGVLADVLDFVESDSHLTWRAIETSGLNKAIGDLQKGRGQSEEELRKMIARVVKKMVEVSDAARGSGSCLSVKASYGEKEKVLQGVRRSQLDKIVLSQADTWHELPKKHTSWQVCGEAPMLVDTPEGKPQFLRELGESRERVKGRVSVVVPTLSERYKFHGQIWLCFFSQTYQDKELIVVESGERPSPFFSNIVEDKSRLVKYVHFEKALSVGEKRNIAIGEYSTGEIIANFDDDDLYFPAYLATMVKTLTSSKAAIAHLSAWHVIDVETDFCATFNRDECRPSQEEALSLSLSCGFSMVYTYAAWQCLPWPAWTSGEDAAYLKAFIDLGMPVSSRADDGKAMTVLHVQHGRNFHRSVCHTPRTDAKVVAAMIARFENACRRLMKINLCEYEQAGEALLYTYAISLNQEPPPPRGIFLLQPGQGDVAASVQLYSSWCSSEVGLHPHRKEMLQQQRRPLPDVG